MPRKKKVKEEKKFICCNCEGFLVEDKVTVNTSKLLVHEDTLLMMCPNGKWAKSVDKT
jgi:RNase P subunit RPR2